MSKLDSEFTLYCKNGDMYCFTEEELDNIKKTGENPYNLTKEELRFKFENKSICPNEDYPPRDINLSNFSLPNMEDTSNFKKDTLTYKPEKVPNFLLNNNEKFKKDDKAIVIGVVYKYSNGEKNVALKISQDSSDEIILNYLQEQKVICTGILDAKSLGHISEQQGIRMVSTYYTVMDLMDGTLTKLLGELSISQAINIFENVVDLCECLGNTGIYPIDLKPDNILYKCTGKNNYKITLGDFGGIVKKGEFGMGLFKPPEGLDEANEKSTVWQLGILLFFLVYKNLKSSEIQSYLQFKLIDLSKSTQYQINKTINEEISDEKIHEILKGCLRINPNERFSYSDLLSKKFIVVKLSKYKEFEPFSGTPNKQKAYFFNAYCNNNICGEIVIIVFKEELTLESVHLEPDYIGKGVCSEIVSKAIKEVLKETSEVINKGYVEIMSSHPISALLCYLKAFFENGFEARRDEISMESIDKLLKGNSIVIENEEKVILKSAIDFPTHLMLVNPDNLLQEFYWRENINFVKVDNPKKIGWPKV